jgi:NAD(P)H-quinone oxidoreductase subunit 5
MLGHACLRTLQFLRAPTLLHDYRTLENAIGERLSHAGTPLLVLKRQHLWIYRFAMERGYLDSILLNGVVTPFIRFFRGCDALERRWTDFLAGGASRESDQVMPQFGTIEELA